jgi:ornithine cyclodeaminase
MDPLMTLLLSRSHLEELFEVGECLARLRTDLRAASGARPQRVRTDLPGPGTAVVLVPGLVPGIPAYTVKVNAKFPASSPALRGTVCLHDLETGELLALLDSATVTAWRTGLAAALGTHALARSDARRVAVVGAGAQAELVMRGLAALREVEVSAFDLDPARAAAFAERWSGKAYADLAAAVGEADVVVLATWAREPLLDSGDVPPGTHLTSLGADEPGKAELSAGLLRSARVFVDDVDLAVTSGALGNVGLTAHDAAGTLAGVLGGSAEGRRDPSEVTVYAPIGLPWQDLSLSWLAYLAARERGAGLPVDLLS